MLLSSGLEASEQGIGRLNRLAYSRLTVFGIMSGGPCHLQSHKIGQGEAGRANDCSSILFLFLILIPLDSQLGRPSG
jgi:hypothetical protein